MEPENTNQTYHHTPSKSLTILVVLIALVIVGVLIFGGGNLPSPTQNQGIVDYTKTAYQGITGIQGMVTFIDYENKTFVSDKTVLVKNGDNYMDETTTFHFKWTDSTKFLYYPDALSVQANQPWEVDYTYLQVQAVAIVQVEGTPNPETELMATEIRILPIPGAAESAISTQ